MYVDSRVKDKTVTNPSYLEHGYPYTGKTTSLYWDGPLLANRMYVLDIQITWSGKSDNVKTWKSD